MMLAVRQHRVSWTKLGLHDVADWRLDVAVISRDRTFSTQYLAFALLDSRPLDPQPVRPMKTPDNEATIGTLYKHVYVSNHSSFCLTNSSSLWCPTRAPLRANRLQGSAALDSFQGWHCAPSIHQSLIPPTRALLRPDAR